MEAMTSIPATLRKLAQSRPDIQKDWADLTGMADAIDAHLAQPAQAVDVGGDTRRIDHLERLIQCAYLGACFELDGGIHLTIEAPGSEPVAYRYKNNLREAIDADIASGGDHQA